MTENLSAAKEQILALKANQAESPDQPGYATELSGGDTPETVTNMEDTNSATPAVAANTTMPNSVSAQADRKFNAVLYGIPEFRKEQRNMTKLSKTLPMLSPLSHMLTVKSLHKVFVTASVWVSIRNLLNDHVLY